MENDFEVLDIKRETLNESGFVKILREDEEDSAEEILPKLFGQSVILKSIDIKRVMTYIYYLSVNLIVTNIICI